ncbi:MAG: hypothetical protein LQ337_003021 [Flavoplaca oasis]|nr:MAG: hypothetical protein LQ337_003021 [Flavoplaca oasis]
MARITERVGDIFDSPPNSILIHACNTKGSWGAGVAAVFKKYSPAAFNYQKYHCTTPTGPSTSLAAHQKSLVGTCLLIQPFPSAEPLNPKHPTPAKPTPQQEEKKYWIACLFTSSGYGKNVDTPSAILDATKRAIADLREEINERRIQIQQNERMKERYEKLLQRDGDDVDMRRLLAICKEETEVMGECYSVRINSGLFGVPWVETKKVLKWGFVDMVIVRPASQKDEVVESDHDDDPYAGVLHQKEDSTRTVEGAERDPEDRRQHIEEQEPIAGAAQSGSMNKGLKRKNGEGDGAEEKSKKNGGGGRQTKLNFGKNK